MNDTHVNNASSLHTRGKSIREEKLAKQLRTNLAQRKTQARARKNDKGESGKNNAE